MVVVVVVTETRHYHNCESQHSHDQPCRPASGESGAMLSTQLQGSHHQVRLSQHQITFITMQATVVIAKFILH